MGNRLRITTEEGEYCFLSAFQSEKYKDVEVVVGNKYEIEILEPITNDIEWITDEPKMPEVICKARLKNYDKGEVTFEWEYWVSYEINRVNWPNLDDVCTRTGKIKFKGTSTSFNSQITTWLVEFKRSSCEVAYLKARDYKTNQDCEKTIYQWNEGEDVFIGGNVYIQVIAKNPSGRILGLKTLDNLKILGTNPDDITVLTGIDDKLKAVIYEETMHTYDQFNRKDINKNYPNIRFLAGSIFNKKGFPQYGPPNGIGLGQIDNPAATELQLWNWKANRERSEELLNGYFTSASSYVWRIRNNKYLRGEKYLYTYKDENNVEFRIGYHNATDLSEDDILKDAFQRYNTGRPQQKWVPDDPTKTDSPGHWQRINNIEYGNRVFGFYSKIKNGNYYP